MLALRRRVFFFIQFAERTQHLLILLLSYVVTALIRAKTNISGNWFQSLGSKTCKQRQSYNSGPICNAPVVA